jgi:hypothetical protein
MVLTAYVGLSPVTGLFCHRRLADIVLSKPGWADLNSAKLDASVGASGPHDFAVRDQHLSSACRGIAHKSFDQPCNPVARKTLPRPPHPHPASVTIAIRPSCGVGWREFVEMICPTGEAKYFCKGDSTRLSINRPTGKSTAEPFAPRLVLRPESCSWPGSNNTQSQRSLNDHDKDCGARNSDQKPPRLQQTFLGLTYLQLKLSNATTLVAAT